MLNTIVAQFGDKHIKIILWRKIITIICVSPFWTLRVWIQQPDQMRTQVNATVVFSDLGFWVISPLRSCPKWNFLGRDTEQSWVSHTFFFRLFEALEAVHMDELTISRLKVTPWLRPCQKQLLLCLIQCNKESCEWKVMKSTAVQLKCTSTRLL